MFSLLWKAICISLIDIIWNDKLEFVEQFEKGTATRQSENCLQFSLCLGDRKKWFRIVKSNANREVFPIRTCPKLYKGTARVRFGKSKKAYNRRKISCKDIFHPIWNYFKLRCILSLFLKLFYCLFAVWTFFTSPTNSNLNENKCFVMLSEATAKSKNLKTDVSTRFTRSTWHLVSSR